MTLSARSYNHDADFAVVCDFIADTFFQNPTYQVWIPSRFENTILYDKSRSQHVHLWWDDRTLVGVVVVEIPNNIIYVHHNGYKYLIPRMLQWAEKTLKNENLETELEFFTFELKDNDDGILVLESLGYQFVDECEHTQLRSITEPLPEGYLPDGFCIKQIPPEDYEQYVKAIKTVFHHDHFTPEVFTEMRKAKFYKEDLLLGVFSSEGKLAAFAQQRIDEHKIIEFEPVGTLPNYRKMGLAKALMRESFIRAEKYNPKVFYVGGAPTEEADRLYASVGFSDMRIITRWSKKVQL